MQIPVNGSCPFTHGARSQSGRMPTESTPAFAKVYLTWEKWSRSIVKQHREQNDVE